MAVRIQICLSLLVLLMGVVSARAATVEEARTLKNEALKLIQSGSNSEADPKVYAEAEAKLKKAQGILESLNQTDSTLAQEVNAALFWAHRFTVVEVARPKTTSSPAASGPSTTASTPKPEPAPETQATPPPAAPAGPSLAEARSRFEATMKFAQENATDDFVLALKWFQTADELAGTEYSARALTLAREAQERNLEKQAAAQATAQASDQIAEQKQPPKKEELPDTPGYRLLKQADELAAAGKYDEAFSVYKRAVVLAPSAISHRRFGLAYFKYAQLLKDRLGTAKEEAEQAYNRARADASNQPAFPPPQGRWGGRRRTPTTETPEVAEARRKLERLQERAAEADGYYDKAWEEFKKALNSSPGRRNLDAAAHAALCLSLKFDMMVKDAAILALDEVLDKYKPANDVERTLYEFCRSERARLVR